MSRPHRVVVTGLGPVSSIGVGVDRFATSLREGRSGISPITSFDTTGFPHVCGGEVQHFEPAPLLQRLDVSRWGRSTLFAAAAARLAVTDARLDVASVPSDRIGVVIGTTCGESQVLEALTKEVLAAGFAHQSPALLRQSSGNRLAYGVSEEIGATGESLTISTACAASNYALGYAYDRLAHGDVDVMIAGGADSVCQWVHAGFFRLGTLAKDSCAPFDRNRAGILTAEGGAALVLETLAGARGRGARIYAEVCGYGLNCDADHMVAPNASSIAACMRAAHAHAHICAADVDYICGHGTGTPANDSAELRAIREVFGAHPPPVSSIKSMLGHTMGAASGFGAIASALAITLGFLPATINWTMPDPDIGNFDVVPVHARTAHVRVVQNDGFAFGGNNAIVLLAACA
jgi:3-oxoacyl-[acyl-carrier-protein] synthase II